MTINEKISNLRKLMKDHQLDAYIIPSSDPHQSEYVADHWKAREWISGFTGSAGTVAVTADHAGLWTDSRYFLQAEEQLASSEMELHKLNNQAAAEHADWLAESLPFGSRIGCDGNVFSVGQLEALKKIFAPKEILLITAHDLIKGIWATRPALPTSAIFEQPLKFAGLSRSQKMKMIRKEMQEKGADYHLICTLDDIAWTFNIRGKDVECNPVAIAYALIGMKDARLLINPEKVPAGLRQNLERDGVQLVPYTAVYELLSSLPPETKILVDPNTTNANLFQAIPKSSILKGETLPLNMKAIKNPSEVEGIKVAMVKDGIALTRLFRWLEAELEHRAVPEAELAEKLAGFRAQNNGYHGESFAAIVGYKGNGAIIHYRPMPETCAHIEKSGILLLDSGGQYDEGTTDITRTVALGQPTPEQKQNYTLVLKGHISLDQAIFPEGTKGVQLDILARQFLWQYFLNYGHGTGHGVGCFLNVHEPPQGFVPNFSTRGTTAFKEGMFTSNEPGFYKTGEYGIRIENLVLATKAAENEDYGVFLKFESLTLFPIDTTLIDRELMTPSEIKWLNVYHQMVYEKLSPHLSEEERDWMKAKCQSL